MPNNKLHRGANGKLFWYARNSRKGMTQAEQLLWKSLKNRKLEGFRFRRHHPLDGFIADFFCPECNLVVEVDGGYHNLREQKEYDKGRTYELNGLEIKVIRFTNQEVLENMEFVLQKIVSHLAGQSTGTIR